MKNDIHSKAGEIILISDRVDFKPKDITRDKEGCFTVVEGSIHQEVKT